MSLEERVVLLERMVADLMLALGLERKKNVQ